MAENDLKTRTQKFAIDILKFVDTFPNKRSAIVIANQLGRSASSVAANYRSACRARSYSEFISKIGIVLEEADESTFWLNAIAESNNDNSEKLKRLIQEANELTAIFTAASKTAKKNRANKRIPTS